MIAIKQDYNAYGQAKRTILEETPQFNGEMLSSGNLTYMRARSYDSSIGQFTSKDTWIGRQTNSLSQNRNTFVENNPINNVDPSGHFLADAIHYLYNFIKNIVKEVFNPKPKPWWQVAIDAIKEAARKAFEAKEVQQAIEQRRAKEKQEAEVRAAKKRSEINGLKDYLSKNNVSVDNQQSRNDDEYLEYLRKLKQICDEQKAQAEASGNRSLDFSPLTNALNNLWRPLSVVLDIVMGFIPILGGIYGIVTGLMSIFSGNMFDIIYGSANVFMGAISLAADLTTGGAATFVGAAKQFNKIAKLGGVNKFIKTTEEAINASSAVARALNSINFGKYWIFGGLIVTGVKAVGDLIQYVGNSLRNILHEF